LRCFFTIVELDTGNNIKNINIILTPFIDPTPLKRIVYTRKSKKVQKEILLNLFLFKTSG